jgi:TctA family transporter
VAVVLGTFLQSQKAPFPLIMSSHPAVFWLFIYAHVSAWLTLDRLLEIWCWRLLFKIC